MSPADRIGLPVRRTDFDEKADGTARYCADLTPPGLLYAKTLRASLPHARILSVSLPPLPEGYVVVDHRDIPGRNAMPDEFGDWPFFAEEFVNHVGEPILLVVGPDRSRVLDLLARIDVRYEALPPTLELEDAQVVFKEYRFEKGDFERAAADSAFSVEDGFRTGAQEQAYLEPQAVLAEAGSDGVTVRGSLQCPGYMRDALVQALGCHPERVRVVQLPTGGGFGGKEEYPSLLAVQAALAAIRTGHPVRLALDRREDLQSTTKRHPARIRIRTVFDAERRIIGRDVEVTLDGGAYGGLSSFVLERICLSAGGVYDVPNLRVHGRALATNHFVSGAFRGFGGPQAFFAIEMHMEHIALELGLDSFALKRACFLKQGDESLTGGRFRSPVLLPRMADEIAKASGYATKRARYDREAAERRNGTGPTASPLRGIGCSFFFHGCGLPGRVEEESKTTVRVRKRPDGLVEILAACTELGQGSQTTMRKIVARTLSLPLERVLFDYPDTAAVPDSGPTVASRTVLVVGALLQEAAEEMKRRWAEDSFDVEKVHRYPDTQEWDPVLARGDAYLSYSWGANLVEVAIDPLTFSVEVVGLWVVYDIGTPIDERIVQGQIEGGLVQSLGYGGMEEISLRDGRVLQDTLTTYVVPTSADFPRPWIRLMDQPSRNGPFGASGLGEITMVGGAPALALAIQQATGGAVREIPVTAEAIRKTLKTLPGSERSVGR